MCLEISSVSPAADTPSPTPAPTPTPTPEPTPTTLPLTGAIICVDPGHCVTDVCVRIHADGSTEAKNRGTVPRTDLTGYNFSEIPSVLIEMGVMTNPEEDARLDSEAYQDQIVDGIVSSLPDWYGVETA